MFKDNRIIILSILVLSILIIVGINIRGSDVGILFDEQVMESINNRTTPLGISIMKKITFLGSVGFFIPVSIIIFLIMIRNKDSNGIILLILSLAGSFGLNLVIKNIFIRTRPLEYFLIQQGGYSFPSGHAMVSMSFYATMTYILIKSGKSKKLNKALRFICFIIIAAIGFSRIYLGVHWPTDVLVGYLLGYLCYRFIIYIDFKRLPSKNRKTIFFN